MWYSSDLPAWEDSSVHRTRNCSSRGWVQGSFCQRFKPLVEDLSKADGKRKLEEEIRGLAKFKLLIVDEMGYLPFDDHGAHCFFQLISRRYERASTIFSSNKSYGEWGDIFRDHVIAAAILDRILHHCTTVNIKGDGYRLKERKRHGLILKSFSR